MQRVIVVRCESAYSRFGFEYTGLCASFDPVPLGQIVPEYTVEVTVHQEPDEHGNYPAPTYELKGFRKVSL
jgi:hypothetical protein